MQFQQFIDASVNGIPLVAVVLGLVTLAGNWVQGKAKLVVSLLIGAILGVGYQVSVTGVPSDFAGWFGVIVYGLGLGLVASGLYDTGKKIVQG